MFCWQPCIHTHTTRVVETVLKKRPMDGFDVVVDEADITKWAVTIHGPPGTDFEGKKCGCVKFVHYCVLLFTAT
jgi:ubiquitin-protein ligase